jgi:hypothetical protein
MGEVTSINGYPLNYLDAKLNICPVPERALKKANLTLKRLTRISTPKWIPSQRELLLLMLKRLSSRGNPWTTSWTGIRHPESPEAIENAAQKGSQMFKAEAVLKWGTPKGFLFGTINFEC